MPSLMAVRYFVKGDIMSLRQKAEYLTALIFLLLLSSCTPATTISANTPTPSAAATETATPLPTFTSTPIPVPENLLAQKSLLEKSGFIFGDGEIKHLDEDGREWEVVKFNQDGTGTIKALNIHYRR